MLHSVLLLKHVHTFYSDYQIYHNEGKIGIFTQILGFHSIVLLSKYIRTKKY